MSKPLLTIDDVQRWRERLTEIAREIRSLENERGAISQKLEAVRVLLGGDLSSDADSTAPQEAGGTSSEDTKSGDEKPTWPSEMVRVFEELKRPLTYEELKEEIGKGPLAGEYERSDKGFYHAVARLQHNGFLVKHKGWLFRNDDLDVLKEKIAAGLAQDVDEAPSASSRRSPMGEEVKRFVEANPNGSTSGEIIEHLKQDARFSEQLNRNVNGAYNVIARLVKRGELAKEGGKVHPSKKNEPLESGSYAGETAISSKIDEQEGDEGLLV